MEKSRKTARFTRILALALILGGLGLLASCSSEYQPQPRGIGTDPSELKRSPCACLQVEPEPGLPEWFTVQS